MLPTFPFPGARDLNPPFQPAPANSEKNARSAEPGPESSSSSAPKRTINRKVRSCQVCRLRKVRCDKQSPCSNCRRANIACVVASDNRPPRWARRLERVANDAASGAKKSDELDPASAQVMARLRNLEGLVKDLSGQLEVANATAASSVSGVTSAVGSPESEGGGYDTRQQPRSDPAGVQRQFGRLVVQDANQSRYVSSGFWSRVNDELDGLKTESQELAMDDSESSEEEAPAERSPFSRESTRAPSEVHSFLFRHNIHDSDQDLHSLHPLPSQIPFILEAFAENINTILRIVHMPTVTKMVRNKDLSPANEALMFGIYYATIASMEEEDIETNFGASKSDLTLKFRLGLELALAKADFLNTPDLTVLTAFILFLTLLRRHDSPCFVWMLTGLAIRMGQALGLQRDPSHFKDMKPYEAEMRRRVWYGLLSLDLRSSEDQGTELTVRTDSFDTRVPLNIDDADIAPDKTQQPMAREGLTDNTMALVTIEMGVIMKEMTAKSSQEGGLTLDEQSVMVDEIYQKMENGFIRYATGSNDLFCWVGVCVARLVMAKMALLTQLPTLLASPSQEFSDFVRSKLLVAAIEVAEYNHALNAEQKCRHWRWLFQTYTHWYAVVYMLLEICRRPWSPLIERAWTCLHSQWLIPSQNQMDKHQRIWIPLRKLMAKARKHRANEIERLKGDRIAMHDVEAEDRKLPIPGSPGPFPTGSNASVIFREQWRRLVAASGTSERGGGSHAGDNLDQAQQPPVSSLNSATSSSERNRTLSPNPSHTAQRTGLSRSPPHIEISESTSQPSSEPQSTIPGFTNQETADLASSFPMSDLAPPGFDQWLWSSPESYADVDLDVNLGFGNEMDWNSWVESAQGMEGQFGGGNL